MNDSTSTPQWPSRTAAECRSCSPCRSASCAPRRPQGLPPYWLRCKVAEGVLAQRRIRCLDQCHEMSPSFKARFRILQARAECLTRCFHSKSDDGKPAGVAAAPSRFSLPSARRKRSRTAPPSAIRFSIASTGRMPPRAPCAMQFMAAAAQEKSSCRSSGHSCSKP